MPWFNAWEPINFQRGYDSSVEWTMNTPYIVGDIVRPTPAKMALNNLLRFHEYTVTNVVVGSDSGGTEPTWRRRISCSREIGPSRWWTWLRFSTSAQAPVDTAAPSC